MTDDTGMRSQHPCGGLSSDNISSAVNETPVTAGRFSLANMQLKDHFSSGNEFSPKVRKPYTMTKQRERWKEEEHEKFLEALKLYGRDWRQIEEHVGTKTAVQIRSHAQKFFSKVTRNSNGCSTTLVGCIEIPPPRPKRKPLHPYPRKEVHHLHKAAAILEQTRSLSPQLSVSEKECQSPSSEVVTASNSSSILHGSASPDSSVPFVASGLIATEPTPSPLENKSPTPTPETINSIPHEKVSKNLELYLKDDATEKDVSTKEFPIQSLKLFGRTMLVADCHKQTPTVETCASEPDHKQAVNHEQTSIRNSTVMESPTRISECNLNHGALYFIQLNNENSNQGIGPAIPVSWWSSYGCFPFSFVQQFKQADSDLNVDVDDKETHKDQSCCGSDTGSVNAGENGDTCADIDVQSYRDSVTKDELIGKPLFSQLKTSHEKYTIGFVPYKRCVAERDTGAVGEEKRIRLCL